MAIKKLSADGFTLVEIMIVIAIIVTLAAISIPVILASRINANEAAAIVSVRTIVSACQSYYAHSNPHTYAVQLEDMTSPNSDPPYLDSVLAVNKQKQGYRFEYVFNNSDDFELYAEPTMPTKTGNRFFFADSTGIIRAKAGAQAGPSDPSIE